MSRFKYLLDAGHGGMINGKYQTAGKRSPIWEDGSQYFEGVGNRQIVKKLLAKLKIAGMDAVDIVRSERDIPNRTRVARANSIHMNDTKDVLYISVHSDAFHKESAHGYSAYTSRRASKKSKIMAEICLDTMEEYFPDNKLRSDMTDGYKDKSANFTVITDTFCPAVLLEWFFMTNEANCREILMTEEGQDTIVDCMLCIIHKIEENGLI